MLSVINRFVVTAKNRNSGLYGWQLIVFHAGLVVILGISRRHLSALTLVRAVAGTRSVA